MNTFTVDKKTLFSILSWTQPICTKRTTLEITSSILFHVNMREMTLKSTDLEISLQTTSPLLDGDFFQPQEFLVSGKRLYDVVKELDGNITFSLQGNQLTITANSVTITLHTKEIDTFPPFPECIENIMQFNASVISTMLDKVAFLIPQNNANPALNGLLIEIGPDGISMTTTDGHSLAQVTSSQYALPDRQTWLLPRRAIFELKKLLEHSQEEPIFLGICNNQLVFSGQHFNFFSKLLVNKFPEYSLILQKDDFVPATVDRTQFIKTLRRAVCLLSGSFIATQFVFGDETVHVMMHNKEVGNLKELLPVHGLRNMPFDMRFYAPYLLNGLQAFNEDTIKFHLKSASKPIIFESTDELCHITYLVMPVSPNHTA